MTTSVLIVDDDPAVCDLVGRFLSARGLDVSTLHDASILRHRLENARPSIVILDVMMPNVSGLDALRQLRAAGDDIPVIFVTARDAIVDKVEGLELGADDYLSKPFDPANSWRGSKPCCAGARRPRPLRRRFASASALDVSNWISRRAR